MDLSSKHRNSETNSDSTFCPEFENTSSQDTSLPLKMPKKKKVKLNFSQDIKKLQVETINCLKSYEKNKKSVSIKALETKRNDILNVIKYEKDLSKKSLQTFKKKLLLFDEALKERHQNVRSSKSERLINDLQNNSENTILNNLTNQSSVLLLEDSVNKFEIADTNQILVEPTTQLEAIQTEIIKDQPLNLCLRNIENADESSKVNLNNECSELNLNRNNDEFCNPIDLSLKTTRASAKLSDTRKKDENLNVNIFKKSQTAEKINLISFSKSKKLENLKIIDSKNPQSPAKLSIINQKGAKFLTPVISLDNNQTKNKLFEAELEVIKAELKAKINKFFAEQLNVKNPIQYNSTLHSDVYENESNKENIERSQTENVFQNLWSESIIESPSKTQPINYNDLKETIEQQNVCKSDGTDTNHIDIDFSINSPLTDIIYQKDIKSYDQTSISTIWNNSPKKLQKQLEKPTYILSDKHILRLATALNLNVDYLKLQITLCLNDYSRNNYDFDDISVIAPSQSPLNIHQIRQNNRNPFQIHENLNILKTISCLDICKNQNHNVYKTIRKKLKKKQRKDKSSHIFSNFSKR